MSLTRQIIGIYLSLMKSTLRYKSLLIALPMVALIPIYFAIVFGLSENELAELMAGAVVSSGVWVSIALMQDVVYEKEVYKYLEMIIASPTRPIAYMLSHILYSYTTSLVSIIPLSGIYSLMTNKIDSIIWSLISSFILSLSLSSLALIFGIKFRNIKEIGSLPSLISTILVFIPPVYYPVSKLPEWLAGPASLIPSVTAAEMLRGFVQGESYYDPLTLTVYLTLVALVSVVYTTFRLNWRLE